MKDKHVDVLIIGGGPSGAVAGITLRKMGYTTCIVDRSAFPRQKLCGGSMTQKCMDLLAELLPDANPSIFYRRKINRVNFYQQDSLITTVETEIPFYMTDRYYFDNLLLGFYREMGGFVVEGEPFTPGMIGQKSVRLRHTTVKFRVLIGADGVFSQVRKLIDPSFRPDTFCLESEVPFTILKGNPEEADIVFGYLKKGYGWNFPKGDNWTLGLGGDISRKPDFSKSYGNMAERTYGMDGPVKPSGGYLFTGGYVKRPFLGDNILLTGDAAGLTEPVTGEGIYFAMLSGQLAARSIDDYLSGRQQELGSRYGRSLKGIQGILRQARFYRRIFYIPLITRLFLRHIGKRNAIARFYLDNTLSTHRLNYFQVIPRYIKSKKQRAESKD